MTYRDDESALFERARTLQRELDRTQADLATTRAQLATTTAEKARLAAEVERLRPTTPPIDAANPPRRAATQVWFLVGLIVMIVVGALVALLSSAG